MAEAARELRVNPDTIYKWARRKQVRSHKLLGRMWVCIDDVADAELTWRQRSALNAGEE